MWIGRTQFVEAQARQIVEEMRKKLAATGMGVTVIGDTVCLRWYEGKNPLISVTMKITDVDNGEPEFDDDEDK